jgi:hypothetical protein
MAHDGEAVEPERRHRLHLVAGHHTLAVRQVIRRRSGPERVAVAGKVGGDHRVGLREQRRHRMPHEMGLRTTVQEQHRWAGAGVRHPHGPVDIGF